MMDELVPARFCTVGHGLKIARYFWVDYTAKYKTPGDRLENEFTMSVRLSPNKCPQVTKTLDVGLSLFSNFFPEYKENGNDC